MQLGRLALILQFCAGFSAAGASAGLPVLTHVADVKNLDNIDAGRHYPIHIEAQFCGTDFYGVFFQEAGRGVYAIVPPDLVPSLKLGDWVQMTGSTEKGGF